MKVLLNLISFNQKKWYKTHPNTYTHSKQPTELKMKTLAIRITLQSHLKTSQKLWFNLMCQGSLFYTYDGDLK